MPLFIEPIDAIARKKQRTVLYVTFNPIEMTESDGWDRPTFDWKQDPMRETVCQWLTAHGLPWQPCSHVADEETLGSNYEGQIYLDIPFDDNDPLYGQVRDYLENPDGSRRFETVGFWILPLETAMNNAHHDEPGFWERWAKDF